MKRPRAPNATSALPGAPNATNPKHVQVRALIQRSTAEYNQHLRNLQALSILKPPLAPQILGPEAMGLRMNSACFKHAMCPKPQPANQKPNILLSVALASLLDDFGWTFGHDRNKDPSKKQPEQPATIYMISLQSIFDFSPSTFADPLVGAAQAKKGRLCVSQPTSVSKLEETSGHTAASITGLLLIEKLAMEWLLRGGRILSYTLQS